MDRKVKYVQYGCGRMSRWLMRYAMEKGCELLAAFDMNPAVFGKDVSEIIGNDYPVIQAYVAWMAAIYVLINLVTDLIYHFLDPRVRLAQ